MKLWDGSLKGHLRFYKPSIINYVVRSVGIFVVAIIINPATRFWPAALIGIGYVVAEFLSYQIALIIYRRRLKKKYHR
jgi:hypothetical protein